MLLLTGPTIHDPRSMIPASFETEDLPAFGDEGGELVDDEIQAGRDFLGSAVGDEPFEGEVAVGDWVLIEHGYGLGSEGFLPLPRRWRGPP